MAMKHRRLARCRYCWRNFALEQMVRSDAECPLHHAVTYCAVHGAINCAGRQNDCSGSARYPGAPVPDAV